MKAGSVLTALSSRGLQRLERSAGRSWQGRPGALHRFARLTQIEPQSCSRVTQRIDEPCLQGGEVLARDPRSARAVDGLELSLEGSTLRRGSERSVHIHLRRGGSADSTELLRTGLSTCFLQGSLDCGVRDQVEVGRFIERDTQAFPQGPL